MIEKLKYGQVVLIKGKTFTVVGMIEFQEDTWVWQEYKIVSDSNEIRWLSIEEVDGKQQYSIYKENYGIPNVLSMKVEYKNEQYELFEQGNAKVKEYYGKVDVDKNEKVKFEEYINPDKTKLISVENWSGEVEKSEGYYVDNNDVKITSDIKKMAKPAAKSSKIGAIYAIIVLAIFSVIGITAFTSSRNALSNYIKSNSKFTYVTSVTNNENGKKAQVYKTTGTVEETVKIIIDGIPENIKKVTETSEDDDSGVGIFTNSEYAYVYKSSDNKTYVQVSDKKYVTSGTNSYHSRSLTRGYYRTYSTNSTNSDYTSYLNSARQQSINSRKSSGGGTSSGK